MAALGFITVLLFSLTLAYSVTLSTHFNNADKNRLISLFNSASNDAKSLYYSSLGLDAFSAKFSDPVKVCDILKKSLDTEQISSIYHVSLASKKLQTDGTPCQIDWKHSVDLVTSTIKEGASSLQLLYSTVSLSFLAKPIPATAADFLKAALKADDSIQSHSYVMYAASYLGGDLKFFNDLIEDVVAQADEIDEEFLQYEGGLKTTALVVYTSHLLSKASKLKSAITGDKAVKLSKYLLARKHVSSVAEAALLVSALKALASSKEYQPISISLHSPVSVSEASPVVSVRVCDMFGGKVEGLSLVADTARHISDNAVILSKQPFTKSSADSSLFELKLMSLKPAVGFYRLVVSATSAIKDTNLVGNHDAKVVVKVITSASVKDVEVSIMDKEQGTTLKSWKVLHPEKISAEADYHQKFAVKFSIVDQQGTFLPVHQTFVRLLNVKTQHEVVYVAEQEGSSLYKFDLDLGAKAKDFNGVSGTYQVDLVVGDAVIEKSITWKLADLKLKFLEETPPSKASNKMLYSRKEEIKHLFRQPEKRPPSVVSNFFTALCLLPILILFALWLKIGVNISNFQFSFSAVLFHAGLGGIFFLYFMYFVCLNMFETIKYLSLLGMPTFLFGHRLLASIAARRK